MGAWVLVRIVSWLVYHLKCCLVLKHFESESVLENNLKVCTWQFHFKKYFILFCFKQGFFLSIEMVVKTFNKVWGTGNNNWEHLRELALLGSLEHYLVTSIHLLLTELIGFKPLLLATSLPALFVHAHTQNYLNGWLWTSWKKKHQCNESTLSLTKVPVSFGVSSGPFTVSPWGITGLTTQMWGYLPAPNIKAWPRSSNVICSIFLPVSFTSYSIWFFKILLKCVMDLGERKVGRWPNFTSVYSVKAADYNSNFRECPRIISHLGRHL